MNIGKPDATDEEIIEAAKRSHSWEFIRRLPDKLDTMLKEDSLSQGEKQLLCITRVMLCLPPMLILDEATAFADPDNEAKVQAAFSRLSQGKTVIMIAHRLSSVIDADRIFVLRDGEICQSGTHKELEKADGLYAHMWKEYNQSVCWKVGA